MNKHYRESLILTEDTLQLPVVSKVKPKALLINPPVYDAQYWSRWSQPAGLLRIASYLKTLDYKIHFFDCMEADQKGLVKKSKRKQTNGQPLVIQRDNITKTIWHYGKSWEELRHYLSMLEEAPDEVWITSIMTYWWESTRDTVELVRQFFPNTIILVGGIYPTLAPEHARDNLGADIVFKGELSAASNHWTDLSLYSTKPSYAILTTTRGCPWDCHYCSARSLNNGSNKMRARDADDVLAEIENKMQMGITRFGFYEDNALALRGHLKEILEEIIRRKHRLTLYAPEGFETRMLTKDLLHAMKRAGFEKIHLPFEALKMDTNLGWNRRHASTASFEQAFDAAVEAGFRPRTEQINAFVLFGLPDEKLEDILDSVTYVHHTVGSIIPMLFTPVPGTHIYREHEQYLREQMGWDLQHLNGKFLPFLEYNRQHYPTLRASDYLELESLMSILNDGKFLSRAMNLCDENTASQAFRDTLVETPKRRSLTTDSGNILPDEIWRRVDPILPAPPQGRSNGKPHVTNRQALNGVLYVLKTGISWDKLPKNLGYGSGITCWRRLKLWQERGAWIETQRILQATLANTALIDWERVAIE